MKILISMPSSGKGGPYISHKRIANSFSDKELLFVPFCVPRIRLIFGPKFRSYLSSLIRQEQPDIIQIHGLELVGFALSLVVHKIVKKNIPIVIAVHGSSTERENISSFQNFIYQKMEEKTLKLCSSAYAVSRYVLKIPSLIKSRKALGFVYNVSSTPDKMSDETRRQIRKQLGFSDNNIIFASSGRITIEKGYEDLLQIILSKNYPENVRFLIIGDGPFLSDFKDAASRHALDNVVFTGFVQDVEKYLQISDAFIMCTHHETLCTSIVEAGNCGLPVIATNVGGIPEIIPDESFGLLFSPSNIKIALSYIQAIARDEKLRHSLGDHLASRVRDEFSIKKNKQRLVNIYKTTLSTFNRGKS